MMGKYPAYISQVCVDSDSSFLSPEMSEDSVFGYADSSSSASSLPRPCPKNAGRSRERVSLRGRVHNYPLNSSPISSKSLPCTKRFNIYEGIEVTSAHHRAEHEKTKLFGRDSEEGGTCESIRAKLTPHCEKDMVDYCTPSKNDVLVQRASLVPLASNDDIDAVSASCPPIDCCSDFPPVPTSILDPALRSTYSVDRGQLFPGAVFDSHCHLDFVYRRLKGEGQGCVQSLKQCLALDGEDLGTSFGGCVANFCHPSDWSQGRSGRLVSKDIENSMRDRRVFLTIGCHPHYADRMRGNRMDQLSLLVSGRSEYFPRKVVALGECGLDYSRKNTVEKALQRKVFSEQLKIALKFNLPLVLHIRDAEADGYDVLAAAEVPSDWPIHRHCFTGGWEDASVWLKSYPASKIGITGIVTYQSVGTVREVVRNIPLDRILLETDAPYFLPARVDRSKYPWRCALPGHVIHVAAQVAAIKGVELKTVLEQNLMNVHDVYKVGKVGGDGVEIKNKNTVEVFRAIMK